MNYVNAFREGVKDFVITLLPLFFTEKNRAIERGVSKIVQICLKCHSRWNAKSLCGTPMKNREKPCFKSV
jgi:hypothetical protein